MRLLTNFIGEWQFRREIINNPLIIGQAIFERRSSNELHYFERGQYNAKNKQIIKFYREYFYQEVDNLISVYFIEDDSLRLFHNLAFKNNEASAFHLCGRDEYYVKYQIHDDVNFSIQYDVSGPNKRYSSLTNYYR